MNNHQLSRISTVILGVLFAVVLCAPALSQTKIDVGQCFSEQLVTHVSQNTVTDFLYSYLAVIDESTYYKVQADGSALAILPAGLFKGDWESFKEARRQYFELHSENLAYYQSLESNTRFLPPEWKETIDNCIDRLTLSEGYGVLYVTKYDDPYKVRLEIKYRSTENIVPRVMSSQVDNGSALDGSGKPTSLYRPCYTPWADFTCPRIDAQSEFILQRNDPNKAMHIVLNLDNSQSTGFDIDILPKHKQCNSSYAHSATQTDSRDIEIHTPPNSILLDEYWGSDPNRLQLYFIRLQYPGRILFASCTPIDSYNHVMNNDSNQADRWKAHQMSKNPDWSADGVFQCLGMTNTGNARNTHVMVQYQVPQTECTDVDWPIAAKK